MRGFARVLIILLSTFWIGVIAYACGGYFSFSEIGILGEYENDILYLPKRENQFTESLISILKIPTHAPPLYPGKRESPWKKTVKAERIALRSALESINAASIEETVQRYCQMRTQLLSSYHAKHPIFNSKDFAIHFKNADNESAAILPDSHLVSERQILDSIPQEFSLYAQGAAAYCAKNYEEAATYFDAILQLPSAQRRHKSVWAAYMLGKATMGTPEKAIQFFETTRELARQGYSDVLNLAADSQGWQALAEWRLGKYRDSLRRYIDAFRGNPNFKTRDSIIRSVKRILTLNPFPQEIVRDSLCRKAITAWLIEWRYGDPFERWQNDILDADIILDPGEGELLAWMAYSHGFFEHAEKWLTYEKRLTPFGFWIRSKVLLRNGKIDEAMDVLRKVLKSLSSSQYTANKEGESAGLIQKKFNRETVHSEFGLLYLGRKEFVEAFDAFHRAGYMKDADYIANRVLSCDELKNYVNTHRYYPNQLSHFREILVNRLVEENRWEEAAEYCKGTSKETLINHLQEGHNENNSARIRSEHLYKAGVLVYECDSDLARERNLAKMKERSYDAFYVQAVKEHQREGPIKKRIAGIVKYIPSSPESLTQVLSVSDLEKKRVEQSSFRKHHYALMSISLLWESVELTPDNDPQTAHTILTGLKYAESIQNATETERFHRAMDERCPELTIGEAAY